MLITGVNNPDRSNFESFDHLNADLDALNKKDSSSPSTLDFGTHIPDDILKSILSLLPNHELRSFVLTNMRMFKVAEGEITLRRGKLEKLLINIFNELITDKFDEHCVIKATKIFNSANAYQDPSTNNKHSDAKNRYLRKAFLPLCNNLPLSGFSSNNLKDMLFLHPIIYKEERLLNILFKNASAQIKELPSLICCEFESEKEDNFTFAYLGALKNRLIMPKALTLEIYGIIDKKLACAFIDAIQNNSSIKEVTFKFHRANDSWLIEIIKSINDNPYISKITLLGEKFSPADHFKEMLQNNLDQIKNIEMERDFKLGRDVIDCRLRKISGFIQFLITDQLFSKGSTKEQKKSLPLHYFSVERQSAFNKHLKDASESACGPERKNILNNAILELFKEITGYDHEKIKLVKYLKSYDEVLFLQVYDQLPPIYRAKLKHLLGKDAKEKNRRREII